VLQIANHRCLVPWNAIKDSRHQIHQRIRLALSTRHIEQQEPGDFQATHQTVRGRISYSAGEVGFVIDGQFLTLQQFGKMVETFEGFEFRLDILD
jgi:hypothetical protein